MSKKDIEREAANLRRSGKLDPSRIVKESPEEELRALGQETRTERAFAAAAECVYCARERREKNDGTALCREHLAEAMGL